jgi:hypothetical protein
MTNMYMTPIYLATTYCRGQTLPHAACLQAAMTIQQGVSSHFRFHRAYPTITSSLHRRPSLFPTYLSSLTLSHIPHQELPACCPNRELAL